MNLFKINKNIRLPIIYYKITEQGSESTPKFLLKTTKFWNAKDLTEVINLNINCTSNIANYYKNDEYPS